MGCPTARGPAVMIVTGVVVSSIPIAPVRNRGSYAEGSVPSSMVMMLGKQFVILVAAGVYEGDQVEYLFPG